MSLCLTARPPILRLKRNFHKDLCKGKGKGQPTTGHEDQEFEQGVNLYSFFNLGDRWVWDVNATHRSLYPPGKTRYPLYRRLGGQQGRSGRVRKNLAGTGIRTPDRPPRSQSLYRLSYPCRYMVLCIRIKLHLHLWYRSEPLTFRLQFPTPRFFPRSVFCLFECLPLSVLPSAHFPATPPHCASFANPSQIFKPL